MDGNSYDSESSQEIALTKRVKKNSTLPVLQTVRKIAVEFLAHSTPKECVVNVADMDLEGSSELPDFTELTSAQGKPPLPTLARGTAHGKPLMRTHLRNRVLYAQFHSIKHAMFQAFKSARYALTPQSQVRIRKQTAEKAADAQLFIEFEMSETSQTMVDESTSHTTTSQFRLTRSEWDEERARTLRFNQMRAAAGEHREGGPAAVQIAPADQNAVTDVDDPPQVENIRDYESWATRIKPPKSSHWMSKRKSVLACDDLVNYLRTHSVFRVRSVGLTSHLRDKARQWCKDNDMPLYWQARLIPGSVALAECIWPEEKAALMLQRSAMGEEAVAIMRDYDRGVVKGEPSFSDKAVRFLTRWFGDSPTRPV